MFQQRSEVDERLNYADMQGHSALTQRGEQLHRP